MASLPLRLKSHRQKPSLTLLNSTISSHFYSSSSSSNNDENQSIVSYLNDIKSKLKRPQQQQQQPFQSVLFNKQTSPTSDAADAGSGGGGGGGGGGGDDVPANSHLFASSLSDIKSRLKQQEQQRKPTGFSFLGSLDSSSSTTIPSGSASNDEIRKRLAEFRARASGSSPENPDSSIGGEKRIGGYTIQSIKESLNQLRMSTGEKGKNRINSMSFNSNWSGFKPQATVPDRGGVGGLFGGSDLPVGVFGKEMEEKKGEEDGGDKAETWMREYTAEELGRKLKELRPEVKGKEGGEFSLSELNERLKKVKQIDEDSGGESVFADLRYRLRTMRIEAKTNTNMAPFQGFDILGQGPPSYMLSPPKEHLIEKYFHPDNMSAEEKLKIELEKVRDEFKLHESDCGSAQVQIAQLTTEIIHLSSVLHKKDKHSRRGLLAKVQLRKKLLKYLRRTDWESYCSVLSRLGLRDNPDYIKNYKSKV